MGEKENIEKFTLWERSTRVPLIVSAPGVTQPRASCDQPVSLMDLYPTLVELAGVELPEHLDGDSLVPQLEDPALETDPVVTSYRFDWTRERTVGHAVRSQQYRYIFYPELNLEELYDHAVDSNEWKNVAYKSENAQVREDHRAVLRRILRELTVSVPLADGRIAFLSVQAE